MTAAGDRFRQIGAYGTDNRRFVRTLVFSLVIHGILAWLLFYHLEQFIPPHPPPKAYLVELLTPVGLLPEEPAAVAEEVVLPQEPPVPVPRPKPAPKPAPIKPAPPPVQTVPPPPPQVAITPSPPPSVVMPKTPPELAPPQSLQPKAQRAATTQPQLNEALTPRSVSQRDVDLASPVIAKPQTGRLDNVASLPSTQTLPSVRRNQDVGDTLRAAPNYQSARQTVQATLPEQSGGLGPTTSSGGDVDLPATLSRRMEPRSARTEASLPVDRGQQLTTRTSETAIVSPRGPASATVRSSSAGRSESLPVTTPGFSPATGSTAAVPLPGAAAPTVATRPGRESSGAAMPSGKTPLLAPSSQMMVDQASLAAFRSLKTCLDTELEKRLKIRLAVLTEGDVTCSSGNIRFFLAATETEQTLQVGIAGAGQSFKDRCDALQQAVRCIEQSRR